MPQARDEAGNVWETDAQGNPVRLLSQGGRAAPAGHVFTLPPDPQQQAADARADASAARDAARLHLEQEREARVESEYYATHNDDGTPRIVQPTALGDPRLTGEPYLRTLSPDVATQVKALASGRLAFPSGRAASSPYWQQRISAVAQYDPTFDAINYNARAATRRDFTSGKSAQNIKALNTAIGHVAHLADQIGGTASHGGFPGATAVNSIENTLARSAGSPGITNYEQTAGAVASELTQVFRGTTGAEADIQRYLSELNSNGSREQKQAAITNIMGLLKSRLDALDDQYHKGMGIAATGLDVLDQHSKDALATYLPGFSNTPPPLGGDSGSGGPPPLAGRGAPSKSIPIPPQMQAAHEAYIRAHRGAIDPDAYARFRADLDKQYGFGENSAAQMAANRQFARDANAAAKRGAPVGLDIGPVSAAMTGRDKLNASVFNNPVGAALLGAGSLMGGADEAAGAVRSLINGTPYATERDLANAMRTAAASAYPVSTALGSITTPILAGIATGGLAPGVAKAAGTLPGALAGGAGFGAVNGALENNDDRLGGAIGGAMAGAGGGMFGNKLAGPLLERAMRSRGGQAIEDIANRALNRIPGVSAARMAAPSLSPVESATLRVAPDLGAISTNLRDAANLGLPYSLADADPKLRMLGGAVTRKSINARDLAERTFDPRAADQGDRAIQGIESLLSPTVNLADRRQFWRDTANAQSRPLYEQAFQGGSTAPLESQLGDAFNQSSKAVADAQAELAAAQRSATLSKAGVSRAGNNVYMNAKALPLDREAQAAIDGATQRLAQAQAQHAQVLDMLRKAQTDAATNAPGAIWNPRIQQFIDDPLSKAGMARGLEIQRLEALADGRPFNPTEYAVTGTDAAGNPIVGGVPNLRTLDALKKGYDAILDDYPKDLRGNPIFDQRGRAITMAKQSLLKELDGLSPDYAAARDAYGTYARHGEALNAGYGAAPRGTYARDIGPQLANMTPSQAAEYQAGYATRLRDMVSDTNDTTDPYRLIYGGNERQLKIGTVFPEGAPQFDRLFNLEGDMAKTRGETLGGSPTAGRLQADEQLNGGLNPAVSAAIDIGTMHGTGVPLATAFRLGRRSLGDTVKLGMGKRAIARADEIAPTLFDTSDPNAIANLVDQMAAKQSLLDARTALYRGRLGMFGALGVPSLTQGGS